MAVLGITARLPDSCRHCSLNPTWKPVMIHEGAWELEAWQLSLLRGADSALQACKPVQFRNKQQRSQQHGHATPHSCELMPDEAGSPRKPPAGRPASNEGLFEIRSAGAVISPAPTELTKLTGALALSWAHPCCRPLNHSRACAQCSVSAAARLRQAVSSCVSRGCHPGVLLPAEEPAWGWSSFTSIVSSVEWASRCCSRGSEVRDSSCSAADLRRSVARLALHRMAVRLTTSWRLHHELNPSASHFIKLALLDWWADQQRQGKQTAAKRVQRDGLT